MSEITNKDFEKINLRIGTITDVKQHPKTNDYIVLVDIGIVGADKQLVVNLHKSYSMAVLVGKQVVIVTNLAPHVVEGIESLGLLLVTHKDGKEILLSPSERLTPGVEVCGLSNVEVSHSG